MKIKSNDMSYYRNNRFLSSIPAVTKNILYINIIIWILCRLSSDFVQYMGLYSLPGKFQVYQLVTYMFTHYELGHLFFNMFALYMFGMSLENYWGQKKYLTFYLITGIGAGLIQLLVCHLQSVNSFTIGASGSVFGLLLAFGMLFPNAPLYFMFIPIPIKAKYMVFGYGLIELIFGVSNRSGDNVAHFAHLGGMLFGIILILYWRNKERRNYYHTPFLKKIKRLFKKKTKMTINRSRSESDWEYNARKRMESQEIDRVLEKIKHSGYNSLTESEKKKLFDYSKK